jgi:hypothetical protein
MDYTERTYDYSKVKALIESILTETDKEESDTDLIQSDAEDIAKALRIRL